MRLRIKIISTLIKVLGWLIASGLTLWLVIVKFVVDTPAGRGIAVTGAVLLLILFLIFGRYINLWMKNKLAAIATSKELNQVGRTNPITHNVITAVYVLFPSFILILFLYGVELYAGTLWQSVLSMVGLISIGFIGNIVSTVIERHDLQKQQLLKEEKDKDDIAERVSKKVSINIR